MYYNIWLFTFDNNAVTKSGKLIYEMQIPKIIIELMKIHCNHFVNILTDLEDFGIDTASLGSSSLCNLQMLHCSVTFSTIFEIFFVSTSAFFIKFNKLLLEASPNCLCNFINFFSVFFNCFVFFEYQYFDGAD